MLSGRAVSAGRLLQHHVCGDLADAFAVVVRVRRCHFNFEQVGVGKSLLDKVGADLGIADGPTL